MCRQPLAPSATFSDSYRPFVGPMPLDIASVLGLAFARLHSHHVAADLALVRRRAPHVHPEGDARSCQHPPQPAKLIHGQGIHRLDQDCHHSVGRTLIPQPQAVVQDGNKESLCLAGSCARRDQTVEALAHPFQRLRLVGEQFGILDDAGERRMEDALRHQLVDGIGYDSSIGIEQPVAKLIDSLDRLPAIARRQRWNRNFSVVVVAEGAKNSVLCIVPEE